MQSAASPSQDPKAITTFDRPIKGVYMRPKMKSNRNEISFRHEKSHVYISFHCEPNEIEIIFVFIF